MHENLEEVPPSLRESANKKLAQSCFLQNNLFFHTPNILWSRPLVLTLHFLVHFSSNLFLLSYVGYVRLKRQ